MTRIHQFCTILRETLHYVAKSLSTLFFKGWVHDRAILMFLFLRGYCYSIRKQPTHAGFILQGKAAVKLQSQVTTDSDNLVSACNPHYRFIQTKIGCIAYTRDNLSVTSEVQLYSSFAFRWADSLLNLVIVLAC